MTNNHQEPNIPEEGQISQNYTGLSELQFDRESPATRFHESSSSKSFREDLSLSNMTIYSDGVIRQGLGTFGLGGQEGVRIR